MKWFKLLIKRLSVRRRAYLKGVELTYGDSALPLMNLLPLDDKHYLRHLVRLNRIARGLKPFKKPDNTDISIYGTPWDSEWYCSHINLRATINILSSKAP